MDTSTLRWILIIIGIVVIGSILLFGNPSRERKPKASRRDRSAGKKEPAVRREPTLGNFSGDADASADPEQLPGDQGELNIGSVAEPAPAPEKPRAPAGPPPDRIVTLFLLARDNHAIDGAALLQATVSTGMDFGEMNIFHRLQEGSDKPVFSMANAEKPGHFERDEWNTFETTGIVLFLTLPGPEQALDAWDAMLATGRRMGEILDAELLDEDRSPFTRQREAEVREAMREYDRKRSSTG